MAFYAQKARQRAMWSLAGQVALIALPGIAFGLAGKVMAVQSNAFLSALIWSLPRLLGLAGLWSVRKRQVSESLPTRLLFRAGLAAAWAPLATALVMAAAWAMVAVQNDAAPLMAISEADNLISNICLVAGFIAFGLGFWLGKPR
ncbi:MAG: hypothetical protein GX605_13080 [Chloroflexi bacterium]|nr:hypothetical protein [Chloroflexota bacterium]